MPAMSRMPPVTARILAAYAAPALPLAALTLPLYVMVPAYYAAGIGIPLAAVGQALMLIRLFDAVNDPLIGVVADRIRPSWGRRRTLFAAAIPVVVLAAWMLFVPPADAGVSWLVGSGALLSLGTTACLVPYWAWGAELSSDYDGRSRIAAAREAVVLLGTLVALAIPAAAVAIGSEGDAATLVAVAVMVAVLLPATGLVAATVVPEPATPAMRAGRLREGLGRMVRNRPFLRLLAAFVLNGFANGLPATLFLFFAGAVLELGDRTGLYLLAYFVAGLAGVPLWLRLSRRFGKHRTWCLAMTAACLVFAVVPLLGAGDGGIFLAVCLATGLALGADLALPPAIQADVVDVDTAAGGERNTGAYVAAWGLGTKVALALSVGIAFPLLDAAGFDATGGPQGEHALTVLALLYAAVPIAAKAAAIALMWNFPLDAADVAALQARIRTAGR